MAVQADVPVIGGISAMAEYDGQLTAGTNLTANGITGNNVRVYLEDANVTLSSPLFVDRIGPTFGNFVSGASGNLPTGTQVVDYLIHYNAPGTSGNNNVKDTTVTFDTPILGLIVFDSALNDSDSVFAIPGVTYTQAQFRGLDDNSQNQGNGNDGFFISNNNMTLNINGWTTTNQIDEIRVLVAPAAVPEPATFLGPLLLAVSLAASVLRRHFTSARST